MDAEDPEMQIMQRSEMASAEQSSEQPSVAVKGKGKGGKKMVIKQRKVKGGEAYNMNEMFSEVPASGNPYLDEE